MDKTIAGLIGALAVAAPAQAAPLSTDAVLHASSYAELLRPVPNAAATLQALDDAPAAHVEQVQFDRVVRDLTHRHHHHHHHHRYYRRHHHHHHHHRSPFR